MISSISHFPVVVNVPLLPLGAPLQRGDALRQAHCHLAVARAWAAGVGPAATSSAACGLASWHHSLKAISLCGPVGRTPPGVCSERTAQGNKSKSDLSNGLSLVPDSPASPTSLIADNIQLAAEPSRVISRSWKGTDQRLPTRAVTEIRILWGHSLILLRSCHPEERLPLSKAKGSDEGSRLAAAGSRDFGETLRCIASLYTERRSLRSLRMTSP